MKVVSIGPDGFALKIASCDDHVASLTTADLQSKNVGAGLLSIFQQYAEQVASMSQPPESPEATANESSTASDSGGR
jgi:hypothetical protein